MNLLKNPSGIETGSITGNRVFVTGTGAETRFRVEIDDFGHMIAALNRLVRKHLSTFLPF